MCWLHSPYPTGSRPKAEACQYGARRYELGRSWSRSDAPTPFSQRDRTQRHCSRPLHSCCRWRAPHVATRSVWPGRREWRQPATCVLLEENMGPCAVVTLTCVSQLSLVLLFNTSMDVAPAAQSLAHHSAMTRVAKTEWHRQHREAIHYTAHR